MPTLIHTTMLHWPCKMVYVVVWPYRNACSQKTNRPFVNDILQGKTISSLSSPTYKISIISLKHSTFWTDFANPTGSVCWAAFTQKISDGLLGSGKLILIFGISSPVFKGHQSMLRTVENDGTQTVKPWPLLHSPRNSQWNHKKSQYLISFSRSI